MKLLFVADPLESFKTAKDTTFAMMREASRRGHALWACHPADLVWQRGGRVRARGARHIDLRESPGRRHASSAPRGGESTRELPVVDSSGDAKDWFSVLGQTDLVLAETGAVLMRKDPPFDSEYFYATHLLGQAEREGARVFNRPAALRDHPEKLAILEFPEHIGPTLVTRSADAVRAFHAEHGDIILKPLDGMGGMGIFRVGADGLNLGSITETLNRDGAQTLMVQRYLPEIIDGDKRVLVIGGKPVPYCLARIPQGSEIRGNLAVGGKGVAQRLSARDREIAEHIGPLLAARGLLLVGLDVIGDCLTEINVTSPTGFAEVTQQTGFDVAAMFIDSREAALAT